MAVIGTAATQLLELRRAPPPASSVHGIVAGAGLFSAVVLLLCAMGRAILFSDWVALAIEIGGLVLGALVAIGTLADAIGRLEGSSRP